MDTTVIIAIIISTIVALGILVLVILLFYYHWRNQELLVNFSAFIRENLKLKDEINKLEDENSELKEHIYNNVYPQPPTRMIQKNLMAAAAITLMMTMSVFSSCTDNDDNPVMPPEPETLAECTILWYGTGGGNIDPYILMDFQQFYDAKPESFERVNIVAQYKASLNPAAFNAMDDVELAQKIECGATYRFAVDPAKTLRQQLMETEPYGAMNCDFTCPDSLTNFINWAARTYPAKRYVLVMADHGGGYLPHHDVAETTTTRGMVFDDGHDNGNTSGNSHKCFSGKSFAQGVRNADVRPEGIVLYLCLMNNLEFLYDVKDVTDYIACSTYTLWGTIGAMQSLPDNMAAGLDTRTALASFIDDNVDSWDANLDDPDHPETPNYYDLTLTETKRLNDLAPVLKEFTDRLCDTYQNGTSEQRAAIDECTANAVKVVNQFPLYDMATISKYVPDDGGGGHYEFQKSGTWPATFAATYQQTTFDRLVGWSRRLLINETAPPAWSPSSFYFKLPNDDMSEIPII